ncbi:hypothetical protein R1flu_012271 [Riccia fluitans]|uniref:Uncharacterized protein n=1 Tax=Riccia fluitans TaxID=41844 RepID=A0ABD1ZA63_9MARC
MATSGGMPCPAELDDGCWPRWRFLYDDLSCRIRAGYGVNVAMAMYHVKAFADVTSVVPTLPIGAFFQAFWICMNHQFPSQIREWTQILPTS